MMFYCKVNFGPSMRSIELDLGRLLKIDRDASPEAVRPSEIVTLVCSWINSAIIHVKLQRPRNYSICSYTICSNTEFPFNARAIAFFNLIVPAYCYPIASAHVLYHCFCYL